MPSGAGTDAGGIEKSPGTSGREHQESRASTESQHQDLCLCPPSAASHSQRQNFPAGWKLSDLPTSYKKHQYHSIGALAKFHMEGSHTTCSKEINYLGKLFLKNNKNYTEIGAANTGPWFSGGEWRSLTASL